MKPTKSKYIHTDTQRWKPMLISANECDTITVDERIPDT